MPHILRRRERVADGWACLGEESAGDVLIVPLAQLRAEEARWRAWSGRLGVRLTPADAPEELGAWLARLELIAVEFPNPGDGRGYSQARLLRGRLGFSGELRAVGAGVKQDQVFLLARCGFDALELAAGEDPEAAHRALGRYTVAYQPGADTVPLARQRFRAP
ncbi:MAG TPA: DUF934 domain-containing protein [Steroidobacteraceae bacterium]|nr:DUF934 domain-containing protein [Steroidobacteraceae bacterium]